MNTKAYQAAVSDSSSVSTSALQAISQRFSAIRSLSLRITEPLSAEDCVIQSMPDVSPIRWHLAHTTWFFETFLLTGISDYRPFNAQYEYLFNSYYNTVGKQFPRHQRGLLSRPGLDEIIDYRLHVDAQLGHMLDEDLLDANALHILEIGLQHEQQHQELMLTDIKHVLSCNPLLPAYSPTQRQTSESHSLLGAIPLEWTECDEQIVNIGHDGNGFAFDNEGPRHRALLQKHSIATRCVTNAEFLEFVEDGGYQRPELWLSLGWDLVCREEWRSPLYWLRGNDGWQEFTLAGLQPLSAAQPVSHVSYFEADAFARWAGKRLPTEYEWEYAAQNSVQPGQRQEGVFADHLMDNGEAVQPQPQAKEEWLGNVWQWTSSDYSAYPGFEAEEGALGEYNGKFMCNQYVLRGGSCATSSTHIRTTYRNFFPPQARWQFSGIRLAD
jgi:ergothioneine biosynthesis protein EgtB